METRTAMPVTMWGNIVTDVADGRAWMYSTCATFRGDGPA